MNTSANQGVLVLGGTGHYGREMVRALVRLESPVRVSSRRPNAARSPLGSKVEIIAGDVTDPSITAQSGTITVVAGDLATLIISQPPATLKIGETYQFTVTSEDAHSNSIAVENSEVTWCVTGDIGTIDRTGLFSAT